MNVIFNDDYYESCPWGFGSLSVLSCDADGDDAVAELRKVVEEVTGKKIPETPARRIGFL